MITVIFFGVDDQGNPNGWTGMASAPTLSALYWQIDKHIDPYSVLMYEIDHGCSVALKVPVDIDNDDDVEMLESGFSGPEFHGFSHDVKNAKEDMHKKKMVRFVGKVFNFSLKFERVKTNTKGLNQ